MDRSFSRSHHLAKFGVNWPGASRGVTYLICHVASQKHVIEGSYEAMG